MTGLVMGMVAVVCVCVCVAGAGAGGGRGEGERGEGRRGRLRGGRGRYMRGEGRCLNCCCCCKASIYLLADRCRNESFCVSGLSGSVTSICQNVSVPTLSKAISQSIKLTDVQGVSSSHALLHRHTQTE